MLGHLPVCEPVVTLMRGAHLSYLSWNVVVSGYVLVLDINFTSYDEFT